MRAALGRGPAAFLAAGIALLAAVGLPTPALGYFQAGGDGTAAAGVGLLGAPEILSTSADAAGTVALEWEAASAPGEGVAYHVTRDGEPAGGTCPEPARPEEEVTSCVDSELESGTYTYVVWATWRSWTSASRAAEVTVAYEAGAHFVLSASPRRPLAGAPAELKIIAKDAAGHTMREYAGAHLLTFSGAEPSPDGEPPTVVDDAGAAIAFGAPTELEFEAGIARVHRGANGVMTLYGAGEATISAADGGLATEPGTEVTVRPGPRAGFALSPADATPRAGEADPLEVLALDPYGNVATSFRGHHNLVFSGAGPSPAADAPTVTDRRGRTSEFGLATQMSFSRGVASPNGERNGVMTLYTAGAAAIEVSEGPFSSAPVTVTTAPADAASLSLAAASPTPVAGTPVALTVTALDAYGNTAASYAGSHPIVLSGAEASPAGAPATVTDEGGTAVAFGAPAALSFLAGVATEDGGRDGALTLSRAGATALAASDGTIATAAPLPLTVGAGSPARLAWSEPEARPGALGSPCLFTCVIAAVGNGGTFTARVAVTDALGNVVSDLGPGHVVGVSASAGTVTGGPLPIAPTGLAETAASFAYEAPASGAFADTVTAAPMAGAAFAAATASVTR